MFNAMDKDNSGKLTYTEFRDSFRTLSYGLNDNDINMLIALADEDQDEKISWSEFIPIGIDAIKTFYMRNITKKDASKKSQPDPESLKMVYWDEIQKCNKLLSYKFNEVDTIKDGMISLQHFKNIVRDTKFLTPKEQNLLIRL
jgi:Ca2+-binding EF-hand superfamily protein